MTLNDLLNLELIVVLTFLGLRNFSNFLIFYKEEKLKMISSALKDNLKFFVIMLKSIFKLWWTGDEFEKKIANGLSILFLLSIILLILTFVIGYKI